MSFSCGRYYDKRRLRATVVLLSVSGDILYKTLITCNISDYQTNYLHVRFEVITAEAMMNAIF
jgi:hypothetical protein